MFTRTSHIENNYSRVLTYINIKLIKLCFSLRKDIFNYRDINLISFFNCSIICFIINVYSDIQQNALKYLRGTGVNLNNVLIMKRDFNIKDNNQDLLHPHHSTHADTLRKIVNSFNLKILLPIDQVSTHYMDNPQDLNSVLDLMFCYANVKKFNNHTISLDL